MDGKDEASRYSDYLVLLAALRNTVSNHWSEDRACVWAELMRFINIIQRDTPCEAYVPSAFEVARSLVVLGQPLDALHHIELLIFDVIGKRPRSPPAGLPARIVDLICSYAYLVTFRVPAARSALAKNAR
jgi:hypothetical protein